MGDMNVIFIGGFGAIKTGIWNISKVNWRQTNKKSYFFRGEPTEVVEIEFDPDIVKFERLLSIFWSNHDATQRSLLQQYESSIFFHSGEQRLIAERTKREEDEKSMRDIVTEIYPAKEFKQAEK